jgi:hypothetical protein
VPVTADKPAPYATTSSVVGLIERYRNKGLPSPIDAGVLERAGISTSLVPRTLQSLQSLDLINEEGKPTKVLEGIRLAPASEYKQRLAEWLTAAYADALQFVDPATDDEIKIRDAFRSYKPVGQQDRMVLLFIGLFTAAGVMPERQKQQPARSTSATATPRPKPAARPAATARAKPPHQKPVGGGALPPALAGLLASLPADGEGWTRARRDKFVDTFGAVIDFCFPIVAAENENNRRTDEEEALM